MVLEHEYGCSVFFKLNQSRNPLCGLGNIDTILKKHSYDVDKVNITKNTGVDEIFPTPANVESRTVSAEVNIADHIVGVCMKNQIFSSS